MNEIKPYEPDIQYKKAPVLFSNYQSLKKQALQIADFVSSIQVTEDTMKAAKKMITTTRKAVKGLDSKRLEIKKAILEDYNTFEKQVNELKKIVDDADMTVRSQVKELEEKERETKKKAIKDIWDKRISMYDAQKIPNLFDRWLRPEHLNKTKSLTATEKEMTSFLESIQKGIDGIGLMPDSSEIMAAYIHCLSLSDAIAEVNQKKADEKIAAEIVDDVPDSAVFVVAGSKDIALTEMLLKENKINFRRR